MAQTENFWGGGGGGHAPGAHPPHSYTFVKYILYMNVQQQRQPMGDDLSMHNVSI